MFMDRPGEQMSVLAALERVTARYGNRPSR